MSASLKKEVLYNLLKGAWDILNKISETSL